MSKANSRPITVLTYGTFDLLHYGHIHLLRRARDLGARLVVGVVSDELCAVKGKSVVLSQDQRCELLEQLKAVSEVFVQQTLDLDQKRRDIEHYQASYLVVGDDWRDHPRFTALDGHSGVKVVYLPRTAGVSSSLIRKASTINSVNEQ